MTAKKKSVLDERTAQLHYVLPPIVAVLVYAAAVILDSTATPTWYVPAFGALCTIVIPWAAAGIDSPRSTCWFLFTLFAGITCFLTWTTATTPWQRWMPMILVPGMVLFGSWWHVVRVRAVRVDQAAEKEAKKLEQAAAKGDLPAILESVGIRGVEPGPVEYFPKGATGPHDAVGCRQRLTLPQNGSVTFKQLHGATERIEIAARAEHPIRFTPGRNAADVISIRMYKDILAETVHYPIDRTGPASINDPLPLGVNELGEEVGVRLREVSGKIIGERGSGKSTCVNVHIAYLTRCADALVWMIDLKGGRTARPWAEALDWIATDNDEARRIFAAAKAVIKSRAPKKDGATEEKITPTRQQPAVWIIVEEASQTTGTGKTENNELTMLAKDTVVLGRSEAVDVLFITQRNTVTMIGSGDMGSQLKYTVGLGVNDMNDARRIFTNSSMAREMMRYANDDRYLGVEMVEHPSFKSVLPIKGYRMEPVVIPGVARTNSQWKPKLEPAAFSAADAAGGYASRWERWGRAQRGGGDMSPVGGGGTGDTGQGTPGQSTAARLGLPESPIIAKLREQRSGHVPGDVPNDVSGGVPGAGGDMSPEAELELLEDMWKMSPAEGEHVPVEEAAQVVPAILATVYNLFVSRGAERLHTRVILEHLPGGQEESTRMTARAFGILMSHCGVASLPQAFEVDGERGRGYAFEEVDRAVKLVRDGKKLPAEAFAWPDRQ